MSDPEAESTALNASSSKRRKRNDGSAEHSSDDERPRSPTPPFRDDDQSDGRELSIRPAPPASRSQSNVPHRIGNVKDKEGYSSRSRSATRSCSPPSRSRSRSYDSHSRSQSRSRSRTSSRRTPNRSTSTSRDRDAPKPLRPDFRPSLELSGHEKGISQVRISPDGRWIASASADGTAIIWDADTGAHMDTLVGHMAGVSCLAWSPDSETIATGSDDKAIRLWDRTTGEPAHAAGADQNLPPQGRIGTSARGISGRTDGGVRGSGGKKPLLGHHNYLYCLKFSPRGNILASGSYDEAVFLWDVRAGRLMRSLPAHSDPVSGIDFCMDGTLVVSCSTDGLIRIWDTATGQCLRTLVSEDNPPAASVCFSPNGRFVLASYTDSCIRLWDFVNTPCTVKKTYQGHTNTNYSVGACFGLLRSMRKLIVTDENADFQEERWEESNNVAFVASASEDGDIVMWDAKSKEILQRIEKAHQGVCFWVDVHGETGTMVTCGQDGRILVFRHRDPEAPDAKARTNGHVKSEESTDGGLYPEENGAEKMANGTAGHLEAEEYKPVLANGHSTSMMAEARQHDLATSK